MSKEMVFKCDVCGKYTKRISLLDMTVTKSIITNGDKNANSLAPSVEKKEVCGRTCANKVANLFFDNTMAEQDQVQ